jgi:hypothetical protein
MPPLNEISLPGLTCEANNNSFSSELSLDDIQKLQDEERNNNNNYNYNCNNNNNNSSSDKASENSGLWNPLDYSLDFLLPSASTNSGTVASDQATVHAHANDSNYSLDLAKFTASNDSSPSLPTMTQNEEEDYTTVARVTTVRFYHRVRIHRIASLKEMPPNIRARVWYSQQEFSEIRMSCVKTLRLMVDGGDLMEEEGEYCRRGLECKTPDFYKERQQHKEVMRLVIFEEVRTQVVCAL